jgi:TM2 domain-containing membrane protein YozV/DNA-directed RNA polymerase subunit M/transcription elongation factor TFIIS
MIRFACPGCGATYSVDDAKGGKTGKCPKCQSQFQIPAPEGSPAPPPATAADSRVSLPPPPPPDPNAPVEIAPCPGCQARLSVAATDIGVDVECPYCKTVYQAARADKPPTKSKIRVAPVADDRPSRQRRDEEEDDDRPSRRRRRDEEDEDDRPRRRTRRRYDIESKRIMAGILALLVGWLGVHKFLLGYTGAGIIMILLNCVGVSSIIAIVEGIIYLTKSDEEFVQTYQIGQKEWF